MEELVSTIALYPDPLLAQMLSAATFPDQVTEAYKWAEQNKDLNGEEMGAAMDAAEFTWDASVQALIPFPEVLSKLAQDQAWMKKLGDAVLVQRGDVMGAIQRLRHKAQDAGNLQSNEQMNVTTTALENPPTSVPQAGTTGGGTSAPVGTTVPAAAGATTVIEIQPANPQVIYVPTYPPEIYYPPPPAAPTGAGMMMGFMTGVMIAEAFDDDWYGGCGFGWHSNTVIINNNSFNRNWNNRNNYRPNYDRPKPRGHDQRRQQGQVANRDRPGAGGAGTQNRPSAGTRDVQNRPGEGGAGTAANRPSTGTRDVQNRPSTGTRDVQNRPSAGTRERTSSGASSRGYSRPSSDRSGLSGVSNGRREAGAGSRGRASGGGARGGGGRRR